MNPLCDCVDGPVIIWKGRVTAKVEGQTFIRCEFCAGWVEVMPSENPVKVVDE